MAFGTPVAGTVVYSASGGTSVSPSYPASIVATDQLVMFLGQKPSTANNGTATTPTGWTLREELKAAGGYGTTLGADTGNTNLYVYTKDVVTAGLSGTVPVTLATNGVAWAFITRVPTGGGTISYGSADGQRTTAATSPLSVALTDGASATAFASGDIALWAMCIPTDVTTPAQFSAQSVTATGATFNTAVELREADSTTGNDIGGYAAYATVASGSSSTAPTVTTTVAGTRTNVRGPIALLRIREAAPPTNYTLTAQVGSYSASGVSANLYRNRSLTSSVGSYTKTGIDAILTKGAALNHYSLTANAGAYTKTGTTANLYRNRKLTATAGAYAETGITANLYKNRALTASSGSYSTTGVSAILTYTPAAVNYQLTANAGAYTKTGVSATLLVNSKLTASAGSYSVSGVNAGLSKNRQLIASAGAYVLTGVSASIAKSGGAVNYTLTAQTGAYGIGADYVDDGYFEPGYAGNAIITIGKRPRGAAKASNIKKAPIKKAYSDDDEVMEILSYIMYAMDDFC